MRWLAVAMLLCQGSPNILAADYPLNAANDGRTVLVGNFYQNNEDYTITLSVPAGLKLSVNFTSFFVEEEFDFFYIHDVANTSAPAIGPPGG